MTFFIFPHDERTPIDAEKVLAWLQSRAEVVSIRECTDRVAALRWTVDCDGATFECRLAIDGSAMWADYDVEAACEHLCEFARTWSVPMDLCDEEYSAHIHLHDRRGSETPWAELVRMWSEAEN